MAKRKAARALRRRPGQASKKKTGGRKAAGRSRLAKKAAARKRPASKRRAAAKPVRKTRKPAARALRRGSGQAVRRSSGNARVASRKVARKRPAVKTRPAKPARTRPATKPSAVAKASAGKAPKRTVPILRKPPSLDRERRIVSEDDIIQSTPPSSLDLDRSASAVRSGRRVLKDKYDEHTETSPALTAGDVDADWESAYSVGDEAPGGDNPTPDQDIVDDIGRAVGVEYQDNEELKGEEKIAKRDRNRWELDPASSDDWDDR